MASKSHWRQYANKVIVPIIKANMDKSESELRKLISAEYPFGERAYHPYKIWCDEVTRCLIQAGKANVKHLSKDYNPDQSELF